jgi:hypothetical protein
MKIIVANKKFCFFCSGCSKSPITFDCTDHSDNVPKPKRIPLIVNSLVGMTRLTKALMDGASGLNLMYLGTFE